jgi:hypothetical protein
MRKLLVATLAVALGSGLAITTQASAAPKPATQSFTCVYFQNPTVEFVWSHVCHF